MALQNEFQIGTIIRNAIVFNAHHWNGTATTSDSLLQTTSELFELLDAREIDYVLVGNIALLRYVEGRNTEVIDLIMAVDSLEKLPEIELDSQDIYFARGRFQFLQIDLLLTTNPLFADVQQNFVTPQPFVEQTIPTATVEGLLLLKLYALPSLYRQGNFNKVGIYENDIATLLFNHQTDTKQLIDRLEKYLSTSDLAETTSILADIQKRIDRFRQRPNS